jgi:selenocysteine lyase/cysteine desulfurase
MADAGFITLTRLPMVEGGFVDPEMVASAITPRTRLIVCTHCSNVLGTIQPVEEIGRISREHEVLFLVDAAQSIGLVPISMKRMHVDLLAFAGHKALLGPTGTGGLYVGERVEPSAWREGGTGGDSSSPTQPREYPYWLEGGTPNTVGVAGLGAGIRFLLGKGIESLLAHERDLARRLIDALDGDERFRLIGPSEIDKRTGAVSLVVDGIDPSAVAASLDQSFQIAVRPGLHCAPYIHRELGTFPEGTVRISPGPFNTADDIDRTAEALQTIAL